MHSRNVIWPDQLDVCVLCSCVGRVHFNHQVKQNGGCFLDMIDGFPQRRIQKCCVALKFGAHLDVATPDFDTI